MQNILIFNYFLCEIFHNFTETRHKLRPKIRFNMPCLQCSVFWKWFLFTDRIDSECILETQKRSFVIFNDLYNDANNLTIKLDTVIKSFHYYYCYYYLFKNNTQKICVWILLLPSVPCGVKWWSNSGANICEIYKMV